MKKFVSILFALLFLCCCGCGTGQQRYRYTYLDVFDTVTEITICADSQETADAEADLLHRYLQSYHKLTDIYQEYTGMTNLCTVNRLAGIEPVSVSPELMNLLKLSQSISRESKGSLNICMDSVLSLWEEARNAASENPEEARLPDAEAINEALSHIDPSNLILDENGDTVFFQDAEMKLDVGAVAKGWAVQRVCEEAKALGYDNFLISAGHNVCAAGSKENGSNWKVAVENPENSSLPLAMLSISDLCAVTSGSYQRYFMVDGQAYHHIIDPSTGYPGNLYQMVTVLCADSGISDGLSTALFLMDWESGEALAASYGAEVLWLFPDGTWEMTDGFLQWIEK